MGNKIRIKKQHISATGLLLLITIFIALPNRLFAQQETVNNAKEENAAVYYLKALDLIKYPESKEVASKISGIIKDGWQKDDKELEAVLTENESSFAEFNKGFVLQKCDFDFGKTYKYFHQKKFPSSSFQIDKIKNLSKLLVLKGRYYEKQGNIPEAVDTYLSLLSFARHLSQYDSLVLKLMAMGVEVLPYGPIEAYLNSGSAQKETVLRIFSYLSDYEKEHFSPRELYDGEKHFFLSTVQLTVDKCKERHSKETNKDVIAINEAYNNAILKQSYELADKYYGLLIKAAETNQEVDWKAFNNAMASLKNEFKIKDFEDVVKAVAKIQNLVDSTPGERTEIVASKVVKLILIMSIDSLPRATDNYYSTIKLLNEVKTLAEEKLHIIKYTTPPNYILDKRHLAW